MHIVKINNYSYKPIFCSKKNATPATTQMPEEKRISGPIGMTLSDDQIEKLNNGWKLPEKYRFVSTYPQRLSSLGDDYKIQRITGIGKPKGSSILPEGYIIERKADKGYKISRKNLENNFPKTPEKIPLGLLLIGQPNNEQIQKLNEGALLPDKFKFMERNYYYGTGFSPPYTIIYDIKNNHKGTQELPKGYEIRKNFLYGYWVYPKKEPTS